jgi:hypothetical protein
MVTALVVAIIVAVALFLGQQSTSPRLTGDTISQTFSQGEPCATTTIALAVPTGSDPTATAAKLFDALEPLPGLNAGTYNWKTSSIEVGFCESKTSSGAVIEALAPTDLVARE